MATEKKADESRKKIQMFKHKGENKAIDKQTHTKHTWQINGLAVVVVLKVKSARSNRKRDLRILFGGKAGH